MGTDVQRRVHRKRVVQDTDDVGHHLDDAVGADDELLPRELGLDLPSRYRNQASLVGAGLDPVAGAGADHDDVERHARVDRDRVIRPEEGG